ncbi:MAG: hypothetical protein LBU32_06290 [Clostridiales bacterium]|jgi:hypothetical protein|nr:hypothetical protein [Clostridiales bacterium]
MGSIFIDYSSITYINDPENAEFYKSYKKISRIMYLNLLFFLILLFTFKVVSLNYILVAITLAALSHDLSTALIGYYHGVIAYTPKKHENQERSKSGLVLATASKSFIFSLIAASLYSSLTMQFPPRGLNVSFLLATVLIHYLLSNLAFGIGKLFKR